MDKLHEVVAGESSRKIADLNGQDPDIMRSASAVRLHIRDEGQEGFGVEVGMTRV